MGQDFHMEEVGQRIIERRKRMGLTQEALAELCDTTTQFVSYAETGKRAMRPENLMKLASALNVSTDYLLGKESKPPKIILNTDKLSQKQLQILSDLIDTMS